MPKQQYRIEWTVETYHRARVWAESEEEARELLWSGQVEDIGVDGADRTIYGAEVQDSVLVVRDDYGVEARA